MPPDPGAPANSCWTLMMADVVALMLAFFVLSFSMREMVEVDRTPIGGHLATRTAGDSIASGGPAADPGLGVPLALAPHEGHTTDQLQAPERPGTDAPSLAYLAAILQGDGGEPSLSRVRHDDTMVVVELPSLPDDGGGPLGDGARRPLLALAFLARRFDLDLAVAMPPVNDDSLADRVARALRLRDRMTDTVGFAVLSEVTFVAADTAVAASAASPATAALLVKVNDDAAAGHFPQ